MIASSNGYAFALPAFTLFHNYESNKGCYIVINPVYCSSRLNSMTSWIKEGTFLTKFKWANKCICILNTRKVLYVLFLFSFFDSLLLMSHTPLPKAYWEPSQTFKMELCVKIVNGFQLLYFHKKLHLIWLTEYASDSHLQIVFHLSLPPHLFTRPAPSISY